MSSGASLRTLALGVVLCGALLLPGVAVADDSDRELRRSGTCSGASSASLRLRADDGEIELELEIETLRTAGRWQAIVLRERRIVFRGSVPRRSNRSVRLRRTLRDLYGRETITVRASGPRAEACRVSVTV